MGSCELPRPDERVDRPAGRANQFALEINNPSEAALKVIKCYWDDLGCPEVPGEYNHNEIVVRVMRGDIEVAKGNPDAVVTAIRADFFANAPYLISSVASPAWSPRPGVAGNDSNQHQVQSRGKTPPTRLSDLVAKSQSSRLQKLASLPKADQEAKVAQEPSFAATSETADGGGTISTDDDDGGAKAAEPGRGSEHETAHSENDHARSTDRNGEDNQALVEQMTPDKDVGGREQSDHAVGPNSSVSEELGQRQNEFHVKIDDLYNEITGGSRPGVTDG
jgi:hypothetical protein